MECFFHQAESELVVGGLRADSTSDLVLGYSQSQEVDQLRFSQLVVFVEVFDSLMESWFPSLVSQEHRHISRAVLE